MTTKEYSPHIFSLCALSVLGNAIISMPFYKNGGFFSVLIYAVISCFFIPLISVVLKYVKKHKLLFCIVSVVSCGASIYGAAATFFDYIDFLKSAQMPQANVILLSAILLIVIIFFVSCSVSAILKYCLFVSVIVAVLLSLCFVGGTRNFDFLVLKTSFLKFDFSLNDFLRCFSSFLTVPFFMFLKLKSMPAKPMFFGTLSGFLVLFLCLLQSVLTLGLVPDIAYPYQKAVSIISSGSLFTRLDGLVYFIFFATSITKAAVCTKTVVLTTRSLKRAL